MYFTSIKKSFFLIVLLLSITLSVFSQSVDTVKINYTCHSKPLSEVAKDFNDNYGIRIFYDKGSIRDYNVDLYLKDASIKQALAAMVKERALIPQVIQNDLVVLITKEQFVFHTGQMLDMTGNATQNTTQTIGDPNNIKAGQNAKITGKIKDGSTGDLLIGATIQIENTTNGVTTDFNGNYTLFLKPGFYILHASSIGFEDSKFKVKVLGSGTFNMELYETSHSIDEVSVFAIKADKNVRNSQMGMLEINAKNIKNLTSVTGEKDLIKSMVTMPGIQSVGEFGSGINVRGGGEDQNLYLIEGAPLFNTSHVFGLLSVLNPDVVSGLSLYKGHIPADFGERVSSVLDIKVRENNVEKFKLKGGLGIYNSRLMAEGKIAEKVTYKFGGRTSYSDWLLNSMENYELKNSEAGFYDLNGLINYSHLSNRITLFGYYSKDDFNYANSLKYNYGNILGSLSWNHAFSSTLSSELSLSVSTYDVTKDEVDKSAYSNTKYSSILYKSGKYKFSYTGFKSHKISMGVQAIEYEILPGEQKPIGEYSLIKEFAMEKEKGIETGIFVNDVFEVSDKITINAGLRYSHYFYLGPQQKFIYQDDMPYSSSSIMDTVHVGKGEVAEPYHNFEPRLSMVYALENNNSIKVSYNKSSQYISLISHTSISTPDNIWKLSDSYLKPIKSNVISAGYFQNFNDNAIETSIELYYKKLNNLVEYKNDSSITLNPNIERALMKSSGTNFGVELFIRKNKGDFQGSISYTYSRSLRKTEGTHKSEIINNNEFFPSSYDKPHDLFVVARYHINRRWAISSNFSYATGRPVNVPEYKFEYGGNQIAYFISRNNYRIPDYHRLDVSVHLYESLRLKKKWKGNWTLTIMNVYGRKNAYSLFYKKEEPSAFNDYRQFSMYKLYLIGVPFPTLTYNFIF